MTLLGFGDNSGIIEEEKKNQNTTLRYFEWKKN